MVMRVLWFTNNSSGAGRFLGVDPVTCGWIKSLEDLISAEEEIEMHVSFYLAHSSGVIEKDTVKYWPILSKGSRNGFSRVLSRYFGDINNEDEELLKQVKTVVEKVQPDIIHIHGTEKNFGEIADSVPCPVVLSVQGILNPYSYKYFSGISKADFNKGSSFIDKLIRRTPVYLYDDLKKRSVREERIFNLIGNIIGRTDWDRQICRILAPRAKYFHGNEVMRNEFYGKRWKRTPPDGSPQLVTIMTGGAYKGLETLVECAKLLKKHSNKTFTWKVIGQADNSQIVKIVQRLTRIDYSDLNIQFVGEMGAAEVANVLAECDLYCQVSRIENSPNSLVEAMLIGVPIIATNVGGTNSLINDRENGVLVQEGEPYSLIGEILSMTENFETALKLGDNALTTAHARHNRENVKNEYLKIYKEILNAERMPCRS